MHDLGPSPLLELLGPRAIHAGRLGGATVPRPAVPHRRSSPPLLTAVCLRVASLASARCGLAISTTPRWLAAPTRLGPSSIASRDLGCSPRAARRHDSPRSSAPRPSAIWPNFLYRPVLDGAPARIAFTRRHRPCSSARRTDGSPARLNSYAADPLSIPAARGPGQSDGEPGAQRQRRGGLAAAGDALRPRRTSSSRRGPSRHGRGGRAR